MATRTARATATADDGITIFEDKAVVEDEGVVPPLSRDAWRASLDDDGGGASFARISPLLLVTIMVARDERDLSVLNIMSWWVCQSNDGLSCHAFLDTTAAE
jgi:hypothetical protein